MSRAVPTRRTVLRTTALATTALATPFVRGANAAGKLYFGVWDHWFPKESEVMVKLCNEWAQKEKVDITVDLITSNGDKDLLTLMAEGEARARPRHFMGLRVWYVSSQAHNLEPVDDDRGRDAHYWAPPAQNRTCGFPAYGSHLGWLTAKRSLGQG